MKALLTGFLLAAIILCSASGADAPKRILVFSKSADYEHAIVYRNTAWPGFLEKELLKLGEENKVDFIFSKDGTIFTPENVTKYDAFLFYTSGDLTNQPRNGRGDNYPLMTPEGKNTLLQAIRNGKGFIGVHSAVATFPRSSKDSETSSKVDPYHKMLGAESIGHDSQQNGVLIQVDRKFPGMVDVPVGFSPWDEWHAMKNFAPDLHVILALDCAKMTGNVYQRSNFPVAWARREVKGRVFFTAMGHNEEIWKNPAFRKMLLGGIRWASGELEADITPNLDKVVPQANEIPASARSVNSATRTK